MADLFFKIFFTTASIFFLVVLGGYLRHKNIVNHQAKNSLLKLLINIFLPCLIFDKVGLSHLNASLSVTLTPLIWGFSFIVLGITIGYILAQFFPKILGLENFAQQRTFPLAVGMQNYGFLALPLATSLFPNSNVESALLIHNIGVELAIWTIGIVVLSGSKKYLAWNKLLNPPSIAIIISLLYQQLSLNSYISDSIWVGVGFLGAMAIPVGLLSAGFTIAEKFRGHQFFSNNSIRKSLAGISLRIIILPILMFFALILFDPSITLKKVIIIELAMPGALAPIYLSDYYKADSSTAFQIALATTLVGFVSVGIWLIFGIKYFGF